MENKHKRTLQLVLFVVTLDILSTAIFLGLGIAYEGNEVINYLANIHLIMIVFWIPLVWAIAWLFYKFCEFLKTELAFTIMAGYYYIVCSLAVAHNFGVIVSHYI